jgi:hypothetical protein
MQNQTNSRPFMVWILIFLQVLLGLNALLGGGAFILAPDGHLLQMPFSHLKNTPFSNFLIPGVLLFTFLGLYPIAVGYSLWKRPAWRWPDNLNPFKQIHWSWVGSLASGAIAIIWILVQIQMIPVGFLHVLIFGWGVVLMIITLLPTVRQYYRLKP